MPVIIFNKVLLPEPFGPDQGNAVSPANLESEPIEENLIPKDLATCSKMITCRPLRPE